MERKKIYAIEAVALILGTILVSSISAQNINIDSSDIGEKNNSKLTNAPIDYFIDCVISGTYTTKNSNEEFQIIVKSDTKSIRVTGLAYVFYGDISLPEYCSVKTDTVLADTFIGVCSNGHIKGTGLYEVRIGSYDSAKIKAKKMTLPDNLLTIFFKNSSPLLFHILEKIIQI